MIKYSRTLNCFFETDTGGVIPHDAIVITPDRYHTIQEEISKGGVLTHDKNGYPVVMEPPKPTDEDQRKAKVAHARHYLRETDWYVLREIETGQKTPPDIQVARQAARQEINDNEL